MKLYEIDNAIYKVIEDGLMVDEETGEVIFDNESLDQLTAERESKLEAVGLFIKGLMYEAADLRAEEKALKARRERKERQAERLKSYLLHSMQSFGDRKLETPRLAVNLRKSTQTMIDDEVAIPEEYINVKTEKTPDKAAIKKAIKDGAQIPGAHLETRENLSIK